MGTGNYVRGHDFTDSAAGGCASVNRGFDRADFAAHDRGYQAGVDLFPPDQHHVCGFHGGVSGFNHRDQAATFDHSQGFSFHLSSSREPNSQLFFSPTFLRSNSSTSSRVRIPAAISRNSLTTSSSSISSSHSLLTRKVSVIAAARRLFPSTNACAG